MFDNLVITLLMVGGSFYFLFLLNTIGKIFGMIKHIYEERFKFNQIKCTCELTDLYKIIRELSSQFNILEASINNKLLCQNNFDQVNEAIEEVDSDLKNK